MKHLAIITCITFLFLQTASAQWAQTGGPEGGQIQCLFVDGSDIYAGSVQGGLFKSTDAGATWVSKTVGLGVQTVVAMARSGGYLFLSGTSGFYRSSNGGENWTLIPGFSSLGGVSTIAVQGTHLIAGTSYGGVRASSDTGATWVASNNGLPYNPSQTSIQTSVTVGSTYIICASEFAANGVYRSTDQGANWTPSDSGITDAYALYDLWYNGESVYASGDYLYMSTDGGLSWGGALPGIPFGNQTTAFTQRGDTLFAGGGKGLYAAHKDINIWSLVPGRLTYFATGSLATLGTAVFAGVYGDGVWISPSEGSGFAKSNAGMRARPMTGFVQGSLYGNGSGVFRTTDDGGTWSEVRGNLSDSAVYGELVFADADTLFVSNADLDYGLRRSHDGGATWTQVFPEMINLGIIKKIVRTSSGYWTAVQGIYHSTDGGTTWHQVDSALTAPNYLHTIDLVDGILFAQGATIYRSTDNGASWTEVTPTAGFFLGSAGVTATSSSYFLADEYGAAIYRSTDSGATWSPTAIPSGAFSINQIYGTGNTLLSCVDTRGVYRSTNQGGSWTNITSGLPPTQLYYRVAVDNGWLFAATGGASVWRRPMSDITDVGDSPEGVPERTALAQNYPNPFNPSTRIAWTLAARERVSLKVFDLLGREVATLFDGVAEPGTHAVDWEAGGVPAGVYFYRLIAGSSVETRAMMLVR